MPSKIALKRLKCLAESGMPANKNGKHFHDSPSKFFLKIFKNTNLTSDANSKVTTPMLPGKLGRFIIIDPNKNIF